MKTLNWTLNHLGAHLFLTCLFVYIFKSIFLLQEAAVSIGSVQCHKESMWASFAVSDYKQHVCSCFPKASTFADPQSS